MMLVKGDRDPDDPGAWSIRFRLDPSSGVPTYLQLVQQVEHALRLGDLAPGDQLPKIREVVSDLAVNPNTVQKAYRELEHRGLAAGRPGQGTFIEGSLAGPTLPELTTLRRSLQRWLTQARAAGLDDAGIVALVANTVRESATGGGKRSADEGQSAGPAGGVA